MNALHRFAVGGLFFGGLAVKTKHQIGVLACAALAFPTIANAADIRDQAEVITGKAELVIPDISADKVAALIKESISQWSIPANARFGSMPSTVPARPDEPASKQKYFSGVPVVEYQCGTAYAEITKKPPPVKNAFALIGEVLQACVYPFQKGTKVYLIHTRVKRFESLTSGLFGGITKAIQGSDDEWISKKIAENITSIKEKIPSLLIEKIEIPGAALQEPDKDAVAALIPAKQDAQAIELHAAAKAKTPEQAPTATASSTSLPSMQGKIDARKNLTAMGLTYHSKEQFVEAIRRKDDVAVQLFLDAEGIDLNAKDKGRTPLDYANEVGAVGIIKMISDRLNPATKQVDTTAIQAVTRPVAQISATPKPVETLSPEELAELNAEIDKLNLPPDQKEQYRQQVISVTSQMKAFTNRIDPETGRLR